MSPQLTTLFFLFAVLAVGIWFTRYHNFRRGSQPMPVPVKGPVLAAELIVAMPQLEAILQGPTPEDTANNRRVFAGNLEIDTFFIAAYTGLFLAIAWEIRLAATPQPGLTWIAATLFAIGAAVADLVENHRLQAGLEGRRFRPVRPWGLAKWLLVYLVLATEAPFFWVYPGASGWLLILFRAAAAVFGLTAIAGIAAVVLRKDGLLETSLPGMSIGFLLLLSAYLAVLLG